MFAQSAQFARRATATLFMLLASLSLAGCAASYATPGKAADFKSLGVSRESLTDASINRAMEKKPLAKFPCGIAAVRIQAAGYPSETASTYGTGNYCIVTTRDIETDADMKKIASLPMITGVAPLNRLLLPQQLNTDLELRQAAAALHADILLIYTIDTSVEVEDHLSPASILTLGLSPNFTAQVVTTASAVLLDTRNGYLYGYSEATEHGTQLANGWTVGAAVSDVRKRTETRAFSKLTEDLQGTWKGVVNNFAVPVVGSAQ